jgi:hypothetical protein
MSEPIARPIQRSSGQQEAKLALWTLIAVLSCVPLTAILHHAVFYRRTCMLNPFGPDYNAATTAAWLQDDPSLAIGLCGATVIWLAGVWLPPLRMWTAGFLIAFLPLSIWIWDIPFTGRLVCNLLHDEKTPLRTRHLYLFGAVACIPVVALLGRFQSMGRGRPTAPKQTPSDSAS